MEKFFKRTLFTTMLVLIFLMSFNVFAEAATSVASRYDKEFAETLESYPDLKKITGQATFPLPGLESTLIGDEACNNMIPQGICTTEKYILISAYCGEKEHTSVIHIMDKPSYAYLTTIVLNYEDGASEASKHVGGIAYDGENIWVARSTMKALSRFNASELDAAVASFDASYAVDFEETVSCGCTASFVTFFRGNLWVGVFSETDPETSKLYELAIGNDDTGKTTFTNGITMSLPLKANGVAFAEIDGEVCMAVNSSYGRNNNSNTWLYSVDFDNNSRTAYVPKELPPLAEEICVDGDKVYTLFESAATEYSTNPLDKCDAIVDRVCVSLLQDWFHWTADGYDDTNVTKPAEPEHGLAYTPSTQQEAKSVPTYVGNGVSLYNPDTASMALDMSLATYSLNETSECYKVMERHGYSQIKPFENGVLYTVGSRDEAGNAITLNSWLPINGMVAIKKLYYNGQEKYAIAVTFRGSKDFADYIADIIVTKDSEGFHTGFSAASKICYDLFKNINFSVDGEKVNFTQIIEEMKTANSKYCMVVTGHSLGGAIANTFVGKDLYKAGVSPTNVVAYTFAAPKLVSSSYSYPHSNIFNIVNTDDFVPYTSVTGEKRLGKDLFYYPDDAFRKNAYGSKYQEGQITSWWTNPVNSVTTGFIAHSLNPVYKKILTEIKNNTTYYSSYNTNSDNVWTSNVYINQGCFSNFTGNVTAGYGVTFNNAILEVGGDFIINAGNGSSVFNMTNDNDYLLVHGSFTTAAYNSGLTAGTVEVKGDFTQTGGNNSYNETKDHKTIFSGDKTQTVSFADYDGYNQFENLVLENTDMNFATPIYKLKLCQDTVLTNTAELDIYTELNLSGYNLTTNCPISTSSLILNSGELKAGGNVTANYFCVTGDGNKIDGSLNIAQFIFDSGSLEITGDCLIRRNGHTNNVLWMQNANDYLLVHGNFTATSYSSELTAGTVEVKGDFTANGSYKSYYETDAHKTILSGDKTQTVTCYYGGTSVSNVFENLYLENSDVNFSGYMYKLKLCEDTVLTGSESLAVSWLDLNGYNLTTNGQVTTDTLSSNGGSITTQKGLTAVRADFSGECTIGGDLTIQGNAKFNSANVEVKGNCTIKCSTSSYIFSMTNENDYLLVHGNFTATSYSSELTAGTVEVKGDFTANGSYKSYYETDAHKTILSGDKTQTVTCYYGGTSVSNVFENLYLENSDVNFSGYMYKLKLCEDTVLTGSESLAVSWLDLNGYNLTTNGQVTTDTLSSNGGSITTQKGLTAVRADFSGECTIGGDLTIQGNAKFNSANVEVKGNCTIKNNTSSGIFSMTHENDYLLVHGDFTTTAYNSTLTAGTVEVKGDFTANGSNKSYYEMETHKTILSGDKKQTVIFDSTYYNCFNKLILENESEEGVIFGSSVKVTHLFNHQQNKFVLHDNGKYSSFVDYDGDTLKDNVDPNPTGVNVLVETLIVSPIPEQGYNNKPVEPEITVSYKNFVLVPNADYTVTYADNDSKGTGKVIITGLGEYKGEKIIEFTIGCGHSYTETVVNPTCKSEGYTIYNCILCGETYKDNFVEKSEHDINYLVKIEPSCNEQGIVICECRQCDFYEESYIDATEHFDRDEDGTCDACYSPVCDCMCHKTGIVNIIWKLLRFFYKLFGTNKICVCGVEHY